MTWRLVAGRCGLAGWSVHDNGWSTVAHRLNYLWRARQLERGPSSLILHLDCWREMPDLELSKKSLVRVLCGAWAVVVGLAAAPPRGAAIDFSLDVQPILAKRCFACHGPADQEADLALDRREGAIAELPSGAAAIVPGSPAESELLRRVTSSDHDERMPPEGEGLTAAEIETLRAWIADGAEYARHWAFVAPVRPELPQVQTDRQTVHPIDAFILRKLEGIEMQLAPRAEPGKLIRRLYLDLVGLLPPPEESARFVRGELTYSQLVDQLLDSDHFGERWGRHWLDLARYADTFGYERDDVRPNAWRYRDWVVDSFNRNQPYDQFVVEQLAGDLLAEPSLEQRVAAGLHRMNIKNNESGINKEDYRNREMVDRVNTTSTALLGLTLGCCQCHSHKYDPFTQTEYYQLYAFFNNVVPKDLDIDGTPAEQRRYEAAKAELDARRQHLEAQKELLGELQKHASLAAWLEENHEQLTQVVETLEIDEQTASALHAPADRQPAVQRFWESLTARADDVAKAIRQLSVQERHLPKPYVMTLEELAEERRPTHVLERGDFKSKGGQVQAATPNELPPLAARGDTPDRLDLARWIVSAENPLAARVAVNHIWAHLFGRGIVTTRDDFGTQGQPPTHPELLDWLAVEFVESGWDRKHLIRQIVHSAAYQQSSEWRRPATPAQEIASGDDNQLFARQVRFRVEAEVLRDIFLDASGLLHRALGGPTVHPLIPTAVGDLGFKYKTRWIVSEKPNRYRRGLYIHFKRTNPYPTLVMFDGPESNICQAMRNRSNTPLQALATLNDPVFVECAQALGQQLASQPGSDDQRLHGLAQRLLARELDSTETRTLRSLLADERSWYLDRPAAAAELVGEHADELFDDRETAAWVAVARAALNLDEFVTRE